MKPRASTRFANRAAAAAFYGYGERHFYKMVSLGAKAADPFPTDEPAAVLSWWERMTAAGHIKKKAPAHLVEACAVEIPGTVGRVSGKRVSRREKAVPRESSTGKAGIEPAKPAKLPDSPPARLVDLYDGEEVTGEEMIRSERKLYATIDREYHHEITEGGGLDSQRAAALLHRRAGLMASVQALQKSMKDFREAGDWCRRSQVEAGAQQFAAALVQCLRVELPHEFPRAEHERILQAIDRLAARIPTLNPFQKSA